jgi:hypothetical protein
MIMYMETLSEPMKQSLRGRFATRIKTDRINRGAYLAVRDIGPGRFSFQLDCTNTRNAQLSVQNEILIQVLVHYQFF